MSPRLVSNNIANPLTALAVENIDSIRFRYHDGLALDTKNPIAIAVTARHAPKSIIASPIVAINATFAQSSCRCKILVSPNAAKAPVANVIKPRSRMVSQDIFRSLAAP